MIRQEREDKEARELSPHAALNSLSRGRRYPEEEHPYRLAFERDRDRVIHCSAFRRMEYKTQVFIYHEGDYFRTRLTHSIEVAQISRSASLALGLNEPLAEALALSHDLGHTPFGHAGERMMDRLMADHGGFEHNLQTLRVVDLLEYRYPSFPGLNLTWEVREGIAKHSTDYDTPETGQFGEGHPSLEAQIVEIADEIAYNNHDLDDGLTSGMISHERLREVELWREVTRGIRREHPGVRRSMLRHEAVRRLINWQVTDLIGRVQANLEGMGIAGRDELRTAPMRAAAFSPRMMAMNRELKAFLKENLYNHDRVVQMAQHGQKVVEDLFVAYNGRPELLPRQFQDLVGKIGSRERVVCDYIAGMTDKFALQEHGKHCG